MRLVPLIVLAVSLASTPARADQAIPSPASAEAETATSAAQDQGSSAPARPLPTGHGLVSLLATLGYTRAPVGYGAVARFQWARIPWFDWDSPRVRGELGVEAGLQWLRHSSSERPPWSYREFMPTASAQYNIWLGRAVAIYPRMEFGVRLGRMTGEQTWEDHHSYVRAFSFQGGVGVFWPIGPVTARGEVATDAVRIGVGLNLL